MPLQLDVKILAVVTKSTAVQTPSMYDHQASHSKIIRLKRL
jgi:hypothetical protein